MKTLSIAPGSPWQKGQAESFHGSLRDECVDRELMLGVAETRMVIEDHRRYYNEERPHGGIGYRTPKQVCNETRSPEHQSGEHRARRLIRLQNQLRALPNRTSHTFWTKAVDSIAFLRVKMVLPKPCRLPEAARRTKTWLQGGARRDRALALALAAYDLEAAGVLQGLAFSQAMRYPNRFDPHSCL